MQRKDEMVLGSLLQSGFSVPPIFLCPLRLKRWKINQELWILTTEASCESNVGRYQHLLIPSGLDPPEDLCKKLKRSSMSLQSSFVMTDRWELEERRENIFFMAWL